MERKRGGFRILTNHPPTLILDYYEIVLYFRKVKLYFSKFVHNSEKTGSK